MKKIAVFTGAGISAESGVPTFRDRNKGLWKKYNVDKVASIEGWEKDPETVLDFHNQIRQQLIGTLPNAAHLALAKLEEQFEVTIITQNIDNLHELAGSTRILHLHGEAFKSRSVFTPNRFHDCTGDIKLGDKCKIDGSQLRPHVVLFGEYPYYVSDAYRAIDTCDYLLIIGTSLEIGYTIPMLKTTNEKAKVYYIDPKPSIVLGSSINYVKKPATTGVTEIVEKLLTGKI